MLNARKSRARTTGSGLLVAAALGLVACASAPENIEPKYVAPEKYLALDCEQLASEGASLRQRIDRLRSAINSANEITQGATAIVAWAVLWPDLLLHRTTVAPERAEEYARLLGEYRALSSARATKGCSATDTTH